MRRGEAPRHPNRSAPRAGSSRYRGRHHPGIPGRNHLVTDGRLHRNWVIERDLARSALADDRVKPYQPTGRFGDRMLALFARLIADAAEDRLTDARTQATRLDARVDHGEQR